MQSAWKNKGKEPGEKIRSNGSRLLVNLIIYVFLFCQTEAVLPFKNQCLIWHNEYRLKHQVSRSEQQIRFELHKRIKFRVPFTKFGGTEKTNILKM